MAAVTSCENTLYMVTRRARILLPCSSEFLYHSTHWVFNQAVFSIKTVGSFRILPEEAVLSRGSCSYKRSACCSRVVLSKLLAARKANFLSLLVLGKKIAVLTCSRMLAKTIRHPLYSVAITHYQSPLTHQHEQHITLRQSIDRRTVEWQFCFLKHKLYIVTILECRVFILLFVFPDFFG